MINLEQIKLLEAKVAKAVDYVERLTEENRTLLQREAEMRKKMDSNQGRIDELEVLLTRFRDDQSQIEESIVAVLDRLSQFEQEMEKSLKEKPSGLHAAAKAAAKESPKPQKSGIIRAGGIGSSIVAPAASASVTPAPAEPAPSVPVPEASTDTEDKSDAGGQTCFEIPETAGENDLPDPLEEAADEKPLSSEELDIF